MKKIKGFFKNKKRIWIAMVAILVLISVGIFVTRGNRKEETLTVHPGHFIQNVSASGKVVAAQAVDLSFNETGKVAKINVQVGDRVVTNQILSSLDIGSLSSELASAQANLALKRAEARNTENNIQTVTEQQNSLVANAYRRLLSQGLEAVPQFSSITAEPPVIFGAYSGDEGKYKIAIDRRQNSASGFTIRTSDLESTAPIGILTNAPTPLGTRGLFISFPDDLSDYSETTWYVTIPNPKSDLYLENYNIYQEAIKNRDREIADAREETQSSTGDSSVVQAEIAVAEAEVNRISIEIAGKSIRAPFDGLITNVDAKIGSTVASGEKALAIMSDGNLQIESFIPEINIPFIKVGDKAVVTLDAYGPLVPFEVQVISIDPAETIKDGVSTYRVKFQFLAQDPRILSGMTANIEVTTEEKENVITVPQEIVIVRNGERFVNVKVNGKTEERKVTTGSVSSLGEVEITSGLEDGDVVVLK